MITTLKEVREALDTGLFSAQEVAAQVHENLAGYLPAKHAAAERDVKQIVDALTKLDALIAQEKAEPVAWRNNSTGALSATLRDERLWTPLYTAPQQGKAEPLTDKRCKIKLGAAYGDDLCGHWFFLQPSDQSSEDALTRHSGLSNLQPLSAADPCVGKKDPRCPCRDGDACHYKDCGDTKAFPIKTASEPLTDEGIQESITKAVRDGTLSWVGFVKDDQDKYTIPMLSPCHYQLARAIEAAHGIGGKL